MIDLEKGVMSCGDNHHMANLKTYKELYLAAKNGDLEGFKRAVERVSPTKLSCWLSPAKNTCLHVASKHGSINVVNFIAESEPSMVPFKNLEGENALHLAAKGGDASMVRALVKIQQSSPHLLRTKNKRGNTALHEALFNGHDSVAEYLINEDHELPYCQNEDGESGLFLAAKAGFANCVSLILRLSTDEKRVNELFKEKSPIQAAIQGRHRDALEAMFNVCSSFITLQDEQGRNPLHYAASLGYLEEVRLLLSQCPANAVEPDKNGFLPIHLASIEGHVDVIRLLLQDFPDPTELLDWDCCNILHLAAKNGRADIVKFILKNHDLAGLINMKDVRGNTPLHLATRHMHTKLVIALTWDKRVNVKVVNDKRMTALDVADHYLTNHTRFSQILIQAALTAACTPRSLPCRKESPNLVPTNKKKMASNLLVVSTLIATMTFAAGFTLPGGYNSDVSNGDLGKAILLKERGFHIFVLSDATAMYTSILVSVLLIWSQIDDATIGYNAVTLAAPLLVIALVMMSVAFTAGLVTVISKVRWLSTALLVISITFLVVSFLLLLPLCTPLSSRNPILRYMSYYPFCMLILASSSMLPY